MQDLWNAPFIWGLGGAFIFAGPKFAACFANARLTKGPWFQCLVEFFVCLVIGSVAAGSMAEWVLEFLKREGASELRVLSTVIGLIANPCAPGVTKAMSDRAQAMISKRGEK